MHQIQYRHTGLKYSICNLYIAGGISDGILLEDGTYLLLEDGFYLLQESGVAGEDDYEDFTTYTLVDDGSSHAPPTATKLTITDLYTEQNTAYLYYDFGAAYFQPDFVINFEFCVTEDNSEDSSDFYGLVGCSNLLGTMLDWVFGEGQAPAVRWTRSFTYGQGHIDLSVGDLGYSMTYASFPWSPATVFYCTLTRISAVAPLDCSVLLDVYSDADRTVRMTMSTESPSSQYGELDIPSTDGLTTHRYLNIGTSERPSFSEVPYGSYYVQNVEIISNG